MKVKRELDTWIRSCKVRAFPWIDGEHIYVNVQYFASGQSIEQPPVWEKTVWITDNEAGREFVFEFSDTMVEFIERLGIPPEHRAVITVQSPPKLGRDGIIRQNLCKEA